MNKEYAVETAVWKANGGGTASKELKDTLDEALYLAIGEYRRGKFLVQIRYIPGDLVIWKNGKEVRPAGKNKK